jgi:hypothetical protein
MTWYNFPNSKDPTLHNLQYYSRIILEEKEAYPKDENGRIVSSMPKVKTGSIILHWADRESSKKSKTIVEFESWDALLYDYGELLNILGLSKEEAS